MDMTSIRLNSRNGNNNSMLSTTLSKAILRTVLLRTGVLLLLLVILPRHHLRLRDADDVDFVPTVQTLVVSSAVYFPCLQF